MSELFMRFTQVNFAELENDFEKLLNRLRCSQCGAKSAELSGQQRRQAISPNALTAEVRCIVCGKVISLERLEAVPDTKRCVSCQEKLEHSGENAEEPIFCKKCGARMVWRIRTSVSPVKYFLGCSNYPRCTWVISGTW